MFKSNYYCLIAGLPDIVADDNKIPFLLSDFLEELQLHLSSKDYKFIKLFFLHEDNRTLLSLLEKKEPKETGTANYPASFIEEQLRAPQTLPSYMIEFVNNHNQEKKKYDVTDENELTWLFYDYLLKTKSDFVRDWFEFDMNLKNLTAALNCRKFDKEIVKEIIGDNEFAKALRSSKLKDFGLSGDYQIVDKVISINNNANLVDKEKQLDLLRWEYLEEKTTFEYFTIDRVLSYLIRLQIIDRWSKLDTDSGKAVFNSLIKRLKESFEFSEEFKV